MRSHLPPEEPATSSRSVEKKVSGDGPPSHHREARSRKGFAKKAACRYHWLPYLSPKKEIIYTMFAIKSTANGLLRTSKSLLVQPLRAQGFRPMTILSKQSGEEFKQKVRWYERTEPQREICAVGEWLVLIKRDFVLTHIYTVSFDFFSFKWSEQTINRITLPRWRHRVIP